MLKLHKADSNCRLCKHTFAHHCLYMRVEQGGMQQPFIQPLDMVPCDSYSTYESGSMNMTGKCGCLTWEPMDNLEFLELKSEQAGRPVEDTW